MIAVRAEPPRRPDGLIRFLVGLVLLLAVALALGACTRVVIVRAPATPAARAVPTRPGVNPCGAPGVPGMVDCSRIDTRRIA